MQTLQRHPKDEVFGLVDQPGQVEGILHDVEARGVSASAVEVIAASREEDRDGPAEEDSAARRVLVHTVEMLSDEHELTEAYESHVHAGQVLVGIPISRAIGKEAAQAILKDRGAHDITYYGKWVVEELRD